jgi:hypothetical protein
MLGIVALLSREANFSSSPKYVPCAVLIGRLAAAMRCSPPPSCDFANHL